MRNSNARVENMNKTLQSFELGGTHIEFIHELLLALEQGGGRIMSTQLLSTTNIPPENLQEYVDILKQERFIEVEEHKGIKMYVSTLKSLDFLGKYEHFSAFAAAFGLVT